MSLEGHKYNSGAQDFFKGVGKDSPATRLSGVGLANVNVSAL